MKMTTLDTMHTLPDPQTYPMLLPSFMIQDSNEKDICCLKAATRVAMGKFLTAEERDILYKFYWEGHNKAEIGRKLGTSTSAVCKKINAAQAVLKEQVDYCFEVYKTLVSIRLDSEAEGGVNTFDAVTR